MSLQKKFLVTLAAVFVFSVVGYCVYFDYRDAVIYENCIQNNSLDVERECEIREYCLALSRGEIK